MKISKLIKAFEQCLEAYETYTSKSQFLCIQSHKHNKTKINISSVFKQDGYYRNFCKLGYLIPENKSIINFFYSPVYEIIEFKIQFLKKEITSLKKLQKKGYTHV